MSLTVTIRDESPGSNSPVEWELIVPREVMTVRELIRERVYQEIQDRIAGGSSGGRSLVTLRGEHSPKSATLERWQEEFQAACDGFEENRFVMIVGEQQAESLEQNFEIESTTTVVFLQLRPLIGG